MAPSQSTKAGPTASQESQKYRNSSTTALRVAARNFMDHDFMQYRNELEGFQDCWEGKLHAKINTIDSPSRDKG